LEKTILLELHYLPSIQYVSKLLQYPNTMLEQHENYSKNQQQPIKEVKLKYDEPWQNQHWSAIKSAYGKSPFFEHYEHLFFPIFQKKYEYLWDWNWDLLQVILSIISFEKNIELTEEFEKELAENILDFRNRISPKENKNFEDPNFSQAKYVQVFEAENGFLPNLSILDLIFCTGPEAIIYLERSLEK